MASSSSIVQHIATIVFSLEASALAHTLSTQILDPFVSAILRTIVPFDVDETSAIPLVSSTYVRIERVAIGVSRAMLAFLLIYAIVNYLL